MVDFQVIDEHLRITTLIHCFDPGLGRKYKKLHATSMFLCHTVYVFAARSGSQHSNGITIKY